MSDKVLQQLCFKRCAVKSAVEEERIVICGGDRSVVEVMEENFIFMPWKYFQIDYI